MFVWVNLGNQLHKKRLNSRLRQVYYYYYYYYT
jgi:hypothetical protein